MTIHTCTKYSQRILNPFLAVQVTSVSINLTITCCNPGYKLNSTCKLDPQYNEIAVRTDVDKKYFYIKVK